MLFSRREILGIGAVCILPGFARAQEDNQKWFDLIKRGIDRNIVFYDPKAQSETFLAPQIINKRYSWNHNMSRVLAFDMRNGAARSYAARNPGTPLIGNKGRLTDLYIPPVFYNEFVDRLKYTRGLSRAISVRIQGDDVYFLNIHLHPLAALDQVPQQLYNEANLSNIKKARFVIGLCKGLPEDDEQYVLLGAI